MKLYLLGGLDSDQRAIMSKFVPREMYSATYPEVKITNYMEA